MTRQRGAQAPLFLCALGALPGLFGLACTSTKSGAAAPSSGSTSVAAPPPPAPTLTEARGFAVEVPPGFELAGAEHEVAQGPASPGDVIADGGVVLVAPAGRDHPDAAIADRFIVVKLRPPTGGRIAMTPDSCRRVAEAATAEVDALPHDVKVDQRGPVAACRWSLNLRDRVLLSTATLSRDGVMWIFEAYGPYGERARVDAAMDHVLRTFQSRPLPPSRIGAWQTQISPQLAPVTDGEEPSPDRFVFAERGASLAHAGARPTLFIKVGDALSREVADPGVCEPVAAGFAEEAGELRSVDSVTYHDKSVCQFDVDVGARGLSMQVSMFASGGRLVTVMCQRELGDGVPSWCRDAVRSFQPANELSQ